jgi:hypothetical protein
MARPRPSHARRTARGPALLAAAATAATLAGAPGLRAQAGPPAPPAPDGASADAALTDAGFDSGRWTFHGGAPTRAAAGRDMAWAVPGLALLRDVALEDGVVEVDVYAGFPALVFHAESPDEYETVYLRTPMSGRADAVQYSPVSRRFLSWRLHGDAQAAATFDTAGGANARNRVRAVVAGRTVRVYVNGAAAPSLVAALRHPARGGAVGVWSMGGPDNPAMRFARFRYAARPRADGAAPTSPAALPGAVTRWELSAPLTGVAADAYPPADSARRWRPVTADFDGLVDVSRYRGALIAEGRAVPVAARATLTRERAGRARLAFAYCDRAAVFINGRRVFAGTLPMTQGGDMPRLAARDTVALDLRAGANELLVVTTGQTYSYGGGNGGWGFAARVVPDGAARPVGASRATRPGRPAASR